MFERKFNRRRIGLLGGSFNPPHLGHTAICKWVFSKGLVDEIWVIPCYIHPFNKELLEFEDRMAMCRLVFNKLGHSVKVIDLERRLGGTSYTLRTIERLKADYPEFRFHLITGDDVAKEKDKWRDYDKIHDLVEMIKVPRGSNSPIPDFSSSQVRDRILSRQRFSDLVETEVAVYIVTKGLFR